MQIGVIAGSFTVTGIYGILKINNLSPPPIPYDISLSLQKPECLASWLLAEISHVGQAGLKLFFHNALFKILKKSGVAVCWQASLQLQLQTQGAYGQLDGLLAAGTARAAASCLQPCRSCGYALGLYSQRKNSILMENFLEDWNYSCTSVLPWKRYYVLKLWNIVGG